MQTVYLWLVLFPLIGAVIAGLFGKAIGRQAAHWVTTLGVGMAFLLSLVVFNHLVFQNGEPFNGTVYTWAVVGDLRMEVGFLVDRLTAVMLIVVTFVSLMVHIYTVGYMEHEEGYQKFFSYISLFTFSMLMLVMSNNLLQLFFGWEAVGLVSYLLIGFYHRKESAIRANLKAFLVNRVGDFGFILGIAGAVFVFGTLDYAEIFAQAKAIAGPDIIQEHQTPHHGAVASDGAFLKAADNHGDTPHVTHEKPAETVQPIEIPVILPGVDTITLICILMFVGAMGKSAQVPLHVWLPDSMEGPTPISALIHAATMVTAGIFMVARMSPLYELSDTALSFILIIGSITALFMGFLGIIQNDIKRVVAYSTLSQLGYMTMALGASAYSAAIFHLMTHAFFKALLFLAAGSVIMAMHHEQDIRKMGNLRKYLPITWICFLIGSLALMGFPGSSGFYSKDAIIEAEHYSHLWGAGFAYFCALAGVFVTAFYSTRVYWLVFHTNERFDDHTRHHLHESHSIVTIPLVLLAIPSVMIGYVAVEWMVFGDFFQDSIYVRSTHDVLPEMRHHFHGPLDFALHGLITLPFWLAVGGAVSAWYIFEKRPDLPEKIKNRFSGIYSLLDRKYGFDDFNQAFFANGSVNIGKILWKQGDTTTIDGVMVNGSAKVIGWTAGVVRHLQTGFLFHYAFAMILGLLALLILVV